MDRRQYLRHFVVLLSGTALAQLINLASYPLLGRLYTPVDFGVFAVFIAASAIPGAIACGRFDLVVPTARHPARFAVFWLCLAISALIGLASIAGAAIYWTATGKAINPVLSLLLGATVFLTGFCAASSAFLLRLDFYRAASTAVVVRTLSTAAVQILLALVWPTGLSLILGFFLGFLAQAIMQGYLLRTKVAWRRPRLKQMAVMFRRYRNQVAVDIPSTLLAAVSINLLNVFLLILYDTGTVGFYSLANRMAITPLQFFNDSLSQVFFQKAARAQERTGAFWNEMKFNLLTSMVLSVGVLVGIYLFARPFIALYLGATWLPSAEILVVLAPMLALRSLCMSIATAVFVLRRAYWLFLHNIAMALVMCVAFVIARTAGFDLHQYLLLTVVLLSVEYAVFAILLALAVRRRAELASPQ